MLKNVFRTPYVRLLALLLVLAPAAAPAQLTPVTTDTVGLDTLQALSAIQRGPRNALLWSILPGAGQAYNKRWWKVPLVYSGLLGMVAFADFNQTRYTRFVGALENRCLGDGNVVIFPNAACIPTPDEFDPNRVSTQALIQARDNADRARQTAYIGIFVVYVLQAVEAYTDAHLQKFDISEDLSLRLGPVVQPDGMLAAGLTLPLGSGRRVHRQEQRVRKLSR